MKIAVTTPTGQIGNKVANLLLDRKSDVTLIARHPEKVKDLASRGAKVIAGEHSDPGIVEQAVRGADALFWLTPSEMTSHDPLGTARRMAEAGASVIRQHPELHVVQLSSAGAFLPSGTGPIVGLYETEEKFRRAGKNIVSLRPNEFMENVFFSLPTIIGQGSIYTSIPGAVKAPFIATQDIAEIAAEFLLKPIDGHHVIDIVGPQEISWDEWAGIAGQAIGKQIRVVTIPGDKLKAAMSQGGMSPEMAALMVEMEEAAPTILGQFKGEQKRTGKVTFPQFAREVFAPTYKKAVESAASSGR
ncbi:MAG TPA: NmrA family NAD(P)-binding protein [Terriglobales bacterium]|nr:NmrA family NAD(P)-binding protein [Terriglobales bacterium]